MSREQFGHWLHTAASVADLYASLCFLRERLEEFKNLPKTEHLTAVDAGQDARRQRIITVIQLIEGELTERMGLVMESI